MRPSQRRRWDVAVAGKTPAVLHGQLGVAIAKRTYKSYQGLLESARMQQIKQHGGQPQRLLWASTGSKDPKASDVFYITSLAAPNTINTMPEATLKAFADHGDRCALVPLDGANAEETLDQFGRAGIDIDALAGQLQEEGAKSFTKSWTELLTSIASKSAALKSIS